MPSLYMHILACRRRFGYFKSFFFHRLDMQFDSFSNQFQDFLFCFCRSYTTGQIGHISSITMRPFFDNNHVIHNNLRPGFQPCLFQVEPHHPSTVPISERLARLHYLAQVICVVVGHEQYLSQICVVASVRDSGRQIYTRVSRQLDNLFEVREKTCH